jgi:hypothetical protein
MPRGVKKIQDTSLLEAALEGLEAQKSRIEEQIGQVRAMLGGRRSRPVASAIPGVETPRKRQLSPAARRRIAAAQKRRWAEYRKKAGSKE